MCILVDTAAQHTGELVVHVNFGSTGLGIQSSVALWRWNTDKTSYENVTNILSLLVHKCFFLAISVLRTSQRKLHPSRRVHGTFRKETLCTVALPQISRPACHIYGIPPAYNFLLDSTHMVDLLDESMEACLRPAVPADAAPRDIDMGSVDFRSSRGSTKEERLWLSESEFSNPTMSNSSTRDSGVVRSSCALSSPCCSSVSMEVWFRKSAPTTEFRR